MSADLHVKGVDQTTYLDDPIGTIQTLGRVPSIDVTRLRDDPQIPQYIEHTLKEEELVPNGVLLVADSLELVTRDMPTADRAYYTNVVSWLRHFGNGGWSIEGMH